MMPRWATACGVALLACASASEGHPGPLDSYGCHPNVAYGNYHCHRGRLAENSFRSQADMREALKEREREDRARERVSAPIPAK